MKMHAFIPIIAGCLLLACRHTHVVETVDNGVLVRYEVDKAGARHGLFSRYDTEGNLFEQSRYRHDLLHGERIIFYPDGTPEIREHYHNGIFHGPYLVYYKNAQVQITGDYVEGVMKGNWRKYYEDGQLMEVVHFEENEENGPFVEYHQNGKLKAEGTYYHGDNEQGLLKLYDENGILERKMECDSGICHTIWLRADSTTTANE